MLDEDIERDVLGKGVFLSEEEEDLLKILHDLLLEKESVMETYSLCIMFFTCVDSLSVMQLHLAALSTMN